MKHFDYRCPRCRHEIDEIVHDSDEIVPCPKCGATMKRLFSPPKNIITDSIQPGGFFSDQLNMWIEGRSHAKREIRRRGWGSKEFGIEARREEPCTKKPYKAADDLVETATRRKIEEEHGGRVDRKRYQNIREQTAAAMSGQS
jgi:putative FmdB family regulatory protein